MPASAAPNPRFEPGVATVGGKVYAFGGFRSDFTVYRSYASYDPVSDTWANLGDLPAGMAETHMGVAHDDRYVYFAGGFGGDLQNASPSQWITDELWRYDTQTNTWLERASMPAARGAGVLALVGNRLHYIGGNSADRVTNVDSHFVYDIASNAWLAAATPTPDAKDHSSVAVVGTRIYVLGGEYGHDERHQQQRSVDVYDTATGSWNSPFKPADIPETKSHTEGGTYVSGGAIVIAGGQIDPNPANCTIFGACMQPSDTVFSYEPALDRWTDLGRLPAARQGAIVQEVSERVVVALGGAQTNDPRAETWVGLLADQSGSGASFGSASVGGRGSMAGGGSAITPSCGYGANVRLAWRKPRAKLRSIVVTANGKRLARLGGNRRSISIPLTRMSGDVRILIRATAATGKTRRFTAGKTFTECGPASAGTLRLKPSRR